MLLCVLPLQVKPKAQATAKAVISVNVAKKVAIWTAEGQPEEVVPVVPGPRGFCTADFGWACGPVDTEMPNLLYNVPRAEKSKKQESTAAKKKPASALKRPASASSSEKEAEEKPAAAEGKASKRAKFSHSVPEEKAPVPVADDAADDVEEAPEDASPKKKKRKDR